jgi:peptidoglycan/LPS O-acetylase OafA/YrhL
VTLRLSANPDKSHSLWLDWLRFLTAFLVLVGHVKWLMVVGYAKVPVTDQSILTAGFFAFTRVAREAVVVFFVLSGFLAGGRAAELAISGRFQLDRYIIDRASRIMVPLVPAVLLTVLVGIYLGKPLSTIQVLGNLASLQGVLVNRLNHNPPLWSLSPEVWLYVLGAAGALFIRRGPSSHWTIPLAVISILMITSMKMGQVLVVYWLLGALAYQSRPEKPSIPMMLAGLTFMALGTVINQLALQSSLKLEIHDAFQSYMVCGRLVLALGVAIVLPQLRGLTLWQDTRFFRSGRFLAAFSYSLYLTHWPVLLVIVPNFAKCTTLTMQTFLQFVAVMVLCLVFAIAFYWAFESRTTVVRQFLNAALESSRKRFQPLAKA